MFIPIYLAIPESLQNILIPGAMVCGIAAVLGILIVIVSHFFQMPVDEKKEALAAALPGANCGGCGFAGCDGYAQYLADGGSETGRCSVGGEACARELASILGVEAQLPEKQVCRVMCRGTRGPGGNTEFRYEYMGTQTCSAAAGLLAGPGTCTYGCLGFGDCMTVCAFHALSIRDGIIHVDPEKCTACGQCVKICPKHVLRLFPVSAEVAVQCRNNWPGKRTRESCKAGCIGCKRCVKECPAGAIVMKGDLAVIDQSLCTRCGTCVEVCPTHAIGYLEKIV